MKKSVKMILIILAASLWSAIASIAVNYAMYGKDMSIESFLGSGLGCLIAAIAILFVEMVLNHRK